MYSAVYLTSGSSAWRSALAISDQSALRGSLGSLIHCATLSTPPFLASCACASRRRRQGRSCRRPSRSVAPKVLAMARNSRRSILPFTTSCGQLTDVAGNNDQSCSCRMSLRSPIVIGLVTIQFRILMPLSKRSDVDVPRPSLHTLGGGQFRNCDNRDAKVLLLAGFVGICGANRLGHEPVLSERATVAVV